MITTILQFDTKQDDKQEEGFLIPSIKPTDIIEKSTKTSGDWLTRDLERNLEKREKNKKHENQDEKR